MEIFEASEYPDSLRSKDEDNFLQGMRRAFADIQQGKIMIIDGRLSEEYREVYEYFKQVSCLVFFYEWLVDDLEHFASLFGEEELEISINDREMTADEHALDEARRTAEDLVIENSGEIAYEDATPEIVLKDLTNRHLEKYIPNGKIDLFATYTFSINKPTTKPSDIDPLFGPGSPERMPTK